MATAPRKGFAPPPEVLRYFSEKRLSPRFSWLDMWGEEHAHAFTVAKATELELLATFRRSIEGALARGETFETWRAGLEPELRREGWWGRRAVADPSGADKDATVDFSAPRRLRTIFQTNMRTARAAGQWERVQRAKRGLPFLLYVRTTAAEPRKAHLAFAGRVLPVDDPFWRTHFPPNGWGCKCAVRQISGREAERYAGLPGYSREAPPIAWENFVNRRTGAIERVPAGIDPGFGWNPGMARDRQRRLAHLAGERLTELASIDGLEAQARRVVRDIVAGEDFARLHAQAVDLGRRRKASADAPAWTHANFPVAILPRRVDDRRRGGGAIVTASDAALGHSHDNHPSTPADWLALQEVIDRGEMQAEARPAGQPDEPPERLWFFARIDGVDRIVVLIWQAGGWRVMTTYRCKPKARASNAARPGRVVVFEEERDDAR